MSRYMTKEAMQGYTAIVILALDATKRNPNKPVRIVSTDERVQVQIAHILKSAGRISGECRWVSLPEEKSDVMDLLGLNGEWPDHNGVKSNFTNTVWLFMSDFRKERKKVQA